LLNRFSIDLISDYLAFDPTILSEQDRTDECELPIVETQPLQILIETTGSWDINANSPETSTSSHGSSAKRFGFRANENFVCRVVIKTEYYVVYLNDMMLSNSEHLVPVGSINGFAIDGDSAISTILFGDLNAIEKYNSKHIVQHVQSNNPKIIECRLTSDDLLATVLFNDSEEHSETYDDFSDNHVKNNNIKINVFTGVEHNTKQDDISNGEFTIKENHLDREETLEDTCTQNLKTGNTGFLCNASNLLHSNSELISQCHDNNTNNFLSNSSKLIRASSYQLVFDVDSDSNEEIDRNDEVNETSIKTVNLSLFTQTRAKSIQNLFHFHHNHNDNFDHINKFIHESQLLISEDQGNNIDRLKDTLNISMNNLICQNKSLESKDFNGVSDSNQLSGKFPTSQLLGLVREEFELDQNNEESIQTNKSKLKQENPVVKNTNGVSCHMDYMSNFVKSINNLTEDGSELTRSTMLNGEKINVVSNRTSETMNSLDNQDHKGYIMPKELNSMTCESKIPVFRNNSSNKHTPSLITSGLQEVKFKPLKSARKGRFHPDDCSVLSCSDKQGIIHSRIPQPLCLIPNSNSSNNIDKSHNGSQQLPINESSIKPDCNKYPTNKHSINGMSKSEVQNDSIAKLNTNKSVINRNPLKSSQSVNNRKSYPLLSNDMKSLSNPVKNGTDSKPIETNNKSTNDRQQESLMNENLAKIDSTTKFKSTNDISLSSISTDRKQKDYLNVFNQSISQQCKLTNQVNSTTTKFKERDQSVLSNGLLPCLNDKELINCTQPLCENKYILNKVSNNSTTTDNNKMDKFKDCVKQENGLHNEYLTLNDQSNVNHNHDSRNDVKKHLNGNMITMKSKLTGIDEINNSNNLQSIQNNYTDNISIHIHDEMTLNVKENNDNYLPASIIPSCTQSMTNSITNTPGISKTSTILTESTTNGGLCYEKNKNSRKFIQSPKKWLTPQTSLQRENKQTI
uniref:Galectin domain-containing protein n=1 Tax=Schistosoma curassoni TaxID=6186 RepID=A0A183KJA5_9TREM